MYVTKKLMILGLLYLDIFNINFENYLNYLINQLIIKIENYLKGKLRFTPLRKIHAYLFGKEPISSLENLTNTNVSLGG